MLYPLLVFFYVLFYGFLYYTVVFVIMQCYMKLYTVHRGVCVFNEWL